jgi:RHS repeat-associated protein
MAVCTIAGRGQITIDKSPLAGNLPAAIEPGAPVGSFALSNLDSIDPYRGSLNVSIPLLRVGGRGEAGFVVGTNLSSPSWYIDKSLQANPDGNGGILNYTHSASFSSNWDAEEAAPYSPGRVFVKSQASSLGTSCPPGSTPSFEKTYSQIVFVDADGTQHNLVFGGVANPGGCGASTTVRGSVFQSNDGSGVTFVSDSPILDRNGADFYSNGYDRDSATGYLYFPNGVTYRVEGSRIRWIRDRNGNKVTISYFVSGQTETDHPSTITDSVGRTISISHNNNMGSYREDRITYLGYGGASRTIYVRKKPYGSSLFAGLLNTTELFPSSGIGSPTAATASAVDVPYEIELPNTRKYGIRYNIYGEVAEVALPTGGRIEYTHGAGLASPYFAFSSTYLDGGIASFASGQVNVPAQGLHASANVGPSAYVYRRLHWRREYLGVGGSQIGSKIVSQPSRLSSSGALLESVSTDPSRTHVVTVNEGLSFQKSEFYYQSAQNLPQTSNSAASGMGLDPILAPPKAPWEGRILEQKDYDSNGSTLLQQTNNVWLEIPRGVYLASSDVTLGSKKKRQSFTYDSFGNTLTNTLYDWVASGSTPNVVLKTITNTYEMGDGTGGTVNYVNPPRHLTGLLKSRETSGGGITSTVQFFYDEYSLANRTAVVGHDGASHGTSMPWRGNATRSRQEITHPSRLPRTTTVRNEFDILGNVVKFISPNNHSTTFSYDDAPGTAGCSPSSAAFAFMTGIANPVSHNWSYKHDFCTGQIVEETDPNGVKTALKFDDSLDRITEATKGVGLSAVETRTRFVYSDASRTITTYRSLDTLTDDALSSAITYDGLGRTTQTRKSDGQGTIYVDMQYDDFHRVKQQTSPYRNGDTVYWNSTTFDGLGRTLTQTAPGSATTSYTYTDNLTRITDPASIWRESTLDGAGRLVSVKEATGDITSYTYNALDNLLAVSQGSQSRSFSYDSAGALVQATNPESGTFGHYYDAAGNIAQTALPQGGTVTYTYDEIDRPRTTTYSSSDTPDLDFTWDTSAKMRLHTARAQDDSAALVSQTTFTSYDPLGRVLASSHQIVGAADSFNFTYSYDLAGNLKVETYPSGRAVNTHYTNGLLISALTGTKGGTLKNYLTGLSYTPFGALTQVTLGNNLIERTDYLNGLPQLRQIRLGDSGSATLRGDWQFRYCNYGASPFFRADSCSTNNGNVLGQIHTISGASFNQTYNYDSLSRLCSVRETASTIPLGPRTCGDHGSPISGETWYQAFAHDRYGNMATPTDPNVNVHPLTVRNLSDFNAANNRLTTLTGIWNYDTAGNLTKHGGWTLAYDAANRMKTSQPSGGSVTSYVYDADGRRVKKTTDGVSTYFVYDAFGQLAAEYSSAGPSGSPDTHYLTTDHLGSTRLVTNQTGAVVSRHDYLPFGWELYSGLTGRTNGHGYLTSPEGVPTPTQRFTGKERDSETRLDYFGARYYSAGPGRFTSADAPFADQHAGDPQSWNLYAYVRNMPLRLVDPTGRDAVACTPGDNACVDAYVKAGSTGAELISGFFKGGANVVVNISNAINSVVDSALAPFSDFRFGQSEEIPMTETEVVGSVVGDAVLAVVTAGDSLLAKSAATATAKATPSIGEGAKVFRVWGDDAGAWGRSWTTVDPRTVPNFRNAAGLPTQNSGRFVTEGVLQNTQGVTTRRALPLHGNAGGLPEVVIPNPASQVRPLNVQGLNPRF